MRKKLQFLLVLFGVLSSSIYLSSPANAIFGFSKCEKVKKLITKEEDIQKYSWKTFDNGRDKSISKNQMRFSEYLGHLTKMRLVISSDIKIVNLIKNNTNCYSSSSIAQSREGSLILDKFDNKLAQEIKNISQWLPSDQNRITPERDLIFIRDTYTSNPVSLLKDLK